MGSIKTYFRNKIDPELWAKLSKVKKKPKQLFVEGIFLNIQFFLRRRKGFSSVPCIVPFIRLELGTLGKVSACCPPYTKMPNIGNINNQTIEEIWNGKELRKFRKFLFLGQTNKTCKPTCGYLRRGSVSVNDIRTDTEEGASLYDDIVNGRVKLKSHPLRFNLANFTVCNLQCVMCHSRELEEKNKSIPEHVIKAHENLKRYFDKRITIYVAGEGDVLARKDTRELLQNFDSKKYSKVNFQIITNGLRFQPDMWETIKHNNYTYANISVDGATKETYEKIRRGGNWEQMMKALAVFKKAKDEGKFSSVNINMTVMKSNFKEIPQFVAMARSMGFYALLKILRGCWGDENIFALNDKEALQELREVLSDPNLYGSDFDANELAEYIPEQLRHRMGDHLLSIWYPSHILKPPADEIKIKNCNTKIVCN